jgi:hypothetical protein
MADYLRSEQEEQFEALCIGVDANEVHEQEAIEYFERHIGSDGFDAAQWLDLALFYALEVARGVIEMVTDEDKARSNFAEIVADNLDICYGEEDCQRFAEALHFAMANGVPVDLDVVRDGVQRALDDMENWAGEDDKTALIDLRDEVDRLTGET